MTDLAIAIEQMNARIWEEQNQPTDGETLKMAARELNFAIEELDQAADWVNTGMEELKDCVEYDRVASVLNDMENILNDLKAMRDKWQKGEA